jgi:hypothetical protein
LILFQAENETESENEDSDDERPIQGYDPDSSTWIVKKLRERIEQKIKNKRRQDLIKMD